MVERLGRILIRYGVLDEERLSGALIDAKQHGVRLGEYLVSEQGCAEEKIYSALSEQLAIPLIRELDERVDYSLLHELPVELFKNGRCLPLSGGDETLILAVADPLDLDIVLEAEAATGSVVETMLALPSAVRRVFSAVFKDESFFTETAGKISREYERQLSDADEANLSLDEIRRNTESEPVVKMASLIFNEAIDQRASDIHIEPSESGAVVRFRIDGMLKQNMELTRGMYVPLTSRVKILAELDIAEKRVPQDGRIRYTHRNKAYDFRVSTLPTHHGEKTVIRILKHDLSLLDIQNLGMEEREINHLLESIEKPQGMIFVTGPTGSGKSSTLFACLNRIRGKAINITTIENPIEYKLDGVNQVQINEKAGVTFASTLRSILRQDPDVILVGEIRDRETAEIAIQASQTGHLVFSTLHTNDAVSAVTRLRDLGIPGFLISSSLLTVLAQRLIRILCPQCKREEAVSAELKTRWNKSVGELSFTKAFYPVGCKACGQTGFLGRMGIFEILPVTDEARTLITENATDMQLKNYFRRQGMHTMAQNGIEKIRQGVTTPEEVLRVVLIDDMIE